jgi:hypothetical protein
MHALSFLLSALVPAAHAAKLQTVGSANAGVTVMWGMICQVLPFCSLGASTAPAYFAGKVIAIVQSLITVIAILMIIYAAIQLSTSQVDESKVESAKKIVMYACIGLVLSLIGGTFLRYLITIVFPQLF